MSALGVGGLAGSFLALVAHVWKTNALVDLDRTAHAVRRARPVDALLADGAPLGFRTWLTPNEVVQLGERNVVIAAAFVLALLALIWRDRIGALVAVGGPGATGVLTEYFLKQLINVPAPVGARAFPSGHAGGVAAIAVVVVVLVCRRWGRLPALLVAPLVAVPVLLVGAALLRLDYHYPTDVLGGWLLAATVVLGEVAVLSLYRGPGHPLLRQEPPRAFDPPVPTPEAADRRSVEPCRGASTAVRDRKCDEEG